MRYKTKFTYGKTTYRLDYGVGDTVALTSQAGGVVKLKIGKVLAFVMPEQDAVVKMPPGTLPSQLKGQRRSSIPRALVEVSRGGLSSKCDYYTPHVNWPRLIMTKFEKVVFEFIKSPHKKPKTHETALRVMEKHGIVSIDGADYSCSFYIRYEYNELKSFADYLVEAQYFSAKLDSFYQDRVEELKHAVKDIFAAVKNDLYSEETEMVVKCQCVYCGHTLAGQDADNMDHVPCPKCQKKMKVYVSFFYTCRPIE